mmetsp:Transcript_15623/g.31133  ORF Transcript_15623/g.31133 Transcript_15623/m.31133 type:complete len:288 (-) Transcript_15623:56-919(-)
MMVVFDVEVDLSVIPSDFAMTAFSPSLFWSEPSVISVASPLTNIFVSAPLPSLVKVVLAFCALSSSGVSSFEISDDVVSSGVSTKRIEPIVRSGGCIVVPSFFDVLCVNVGGFVTVGASDVVDLPAFDFFDLETDFACLKEVGAIVVVGVLDFFDLDSDLSAFPDLRSFACLMEVGEFVTVGAPDFFDLETTFVLLMEVGKIVNVGAPDDFDFASADLLVFASFLGSEVDTVGRLSLLTIAEGDTDFFGLAPLTTCVTCDNIKEQANKKKIEGLFLWNIMFQCSVKI